MACPRCGCKEHYQLCDGDVHAAADDEDCERCAACGLIFYLYEEALELDEEPTEEHP